MHVVGPISLKFTRVCFEELFANFAQLKSLITPLGPMINDVLWLLNRPEVGANNG